MFNRGMFIRYMNAPDAVGIVISSYIPDVDRVDAYWFDLQRSVNTYITDCRLLPATQRKSNV